MSTLQGIAIAMPLLICTMAGLGSGESKSDFFREVRPKSCLP